MIKLRAYWTYMEQVGWVGDSQNGWPETKAVEKQGMIVGYITRYDSQACAVIHVSDSLEVVPINEISKVIPW